MMTESEFKKLPKSQREAIQQRLKDQGLYAGGIDGNWGAGTENALKQEERRRVEDEERSRKAKAEEDKRSRELKIEETRAAAEADEKRAEAERKRKEAEALAAKTKAKEEYNRQASSPEGMATQSAASLVAPAAATAAGYRLGGKINERLDRAQERRNATLRGAAEDRVRGLTTRAGAVTGAQLAGAMPSENALLRVGSRMAPHIGLGALSAGKGVQLLSDVDEDQAFYPRMADRAAGLGYLGFGAGLAKQGIEYAASPGVSPDVQALSVINSSQLRRNAALPRGSDRGQIIDAEVVPDAPSQPALPAPAAPEGPAPGSKAYYVQEAKRLGVKGATRKTKEQLVQAINEANQGNATRRVRGPKRVPAVAGPLAAAGLAYAATPSDAHASTGEPSLTGQDEALTNAAVAGGITYGANRLLQSLPAGAGSVATGMLGPLAPMTFDPFEGASAEDTRHNIMAARGDLNAMLPSVGRAIGVTPEEQQAYEMAQLPAPSPSRVQRQADTRQDAEYMRRYLANEPVNLPESAPGWQDRAMAAEPDFDAKLAELQQIMTELEGPQEPAQRSAPVVMPPALMVSPALQNRLLAAR